MPGTTTPSQTDPGTPTPSFSRDGEPATFTLTWPKTLAATLILGGSLFGGMLAIGAWLSDRVVQGFETRLVQLREDVVRGADDTTQADRVLRQHVETTNQLLRTEFVALRQEVVQLGDRLIASHQEMSRQVSLLRTELVGVIEKGDARLEGRFDKLDQKIDDLFKRMSFGPVIELEKGAFMVDVHGNVIDQNGGRLGTLPAVVRPAE